MYSLKGFPDSHLITLITVGSAFFIASAWKFGFNTLLTALAQMEEYWM